MPTRSPGASGADAPDGGPDNRCAAEGGLSPRTLWPVAAVSAGIVAVMFLYYARAWHSLAGFCSALDMGDGLFLDFTRVYYPTGVSIFRLHWPAPGYFYSPFFALGLGLVSWPGLPAAMWIWGGLQVGAALLLVLLPSVEILRRSRVTWYVYLAAFLASEPVLHCIKWGQVSILLVLCILGTMYLYRAGWRRAAAVLLAMPISIKFYPALFLVYFLLKRDWWFLAICLASTAVLSLALPVLVLGPHDFLQFCRVVSKQIDVLRDALLNHVNSHYLPQVLSRWLYGQVQYETQRDFFRGLSYSIAALNVLLLAWLVWKGRDQIQWGFVLLFASLPLLVDTSWPHYFVYLPFCQAMVCLRLAGRRASPLNILKTVLLGMSILLSSVLMLNWLGSWERYSGSGLLLVANLLVLVLAYLHVFGVLLGPSQPDAVAGPAGRVTMRPRKATAGSRKP